MTILLKILGYSWLVLSAAATLIVYGFIWILEGHRAVALLSWAAAPSVPSVSASSCCPALPL